MDYTITPAKPRSLVRRLAPWTAALGIFAAGGFGVYRYATPATSSDAGVPSEALSEAESRVWAALPPSASRDGATGAYAAPSGGSSDRYAAAPTLPPAPADEEVTTPRSAAVVDAPVNPFAAAPMGGYGDRYAAPEPPAAGESAVASPEDGAATPPPVEPDVDRAEQVVEAEAPLVAVPAATEVTRGQEPGNINPLRPTSRGSVSAAAAPVEGSDDARAAFSSGVSPPAELALPPQASAAAVVATPTPDAAANSISPAADYRSPVAASSPTVASAPAGEAPFSPFSAAATTTPTPNPMRQDSAATPLASRALPAFASSTPQADAVASVNTANPYGDTYATADAAATPTPGLATADGTGRPGERILEGIQSPGLTLQKLAPPEIQVGKRCVFGIRVQNNSQRAAHNVQIVDETPLGTQLIGTAPKANVSGAQVVWDLGTLSAGEERIVEMELMPTEEGELGSVATVSFATQASAKTRCTRPQLALRLTSNPRVMIGEQHIVQIEVTNPGSGDATGVMLLENIPQGVSHEAGPALEFEIGTLPAGQTKRIDLVLQADEPGLVDNIMTARADANLQVQANCQFEVIAPALKVTVDGPARRVLERPGTFTVSVDNPGTASAREVQLVTQLPKGMKFVSANNMGEYDAATHSVYWSLAELPANQRGTVELTALAVESGDQTLQVATRTQQGLEDRTETHVMVEGIVALSFEVQDAQDAIEVGQETAYDIRVVNQGSKAATNVQIVAQVPPGLRALSGQGDGRYTVQGDRVVFAPLAQLAPKAEAAFRFGVQGLRSGDQRVTLQVTTDEVRDPIVEVESTQVYADE